MKNVLKNRARTFLSAMALSFVGAGMAVAQQPAPSASQPQSIAPVQDSEIVKFAAALESVQNALKAAQSKIQNASGPDEKAQLEQQAREDLVAAVTAEGLTPDRYNQIMQMAQSDPSVMEKVQAELEG